MTDVKNCSCCIQTLEMQKQTSYHLEQHDKLLKYLESAINQLMQDVVPIYKVKDDQQKVNSYQLMDKKQQTNTQMNQTINTYDQQCEAEIINIVQYSEFQMKEYVENFSKDLNYMNQQFELLKKKVDQQVQNKNSEKEILSKFEKIENKTIVSGIHLDDNAQMREKEDFYITWQKKKPQEQNNQNDSSQSKYLRNSDQVEEVENQDNSISNQVPEQQTESINNQESLRMSSQQQENQNNQQSNDQQIENQNSQNQENTQNENEEVQSEGEETNQTNHPQQQQIIPPTQSSLRQSTKLTESLRSSQNQLSQLQLSVRSFTLKLKNQYYLNQHPNPERQKVVFTLINEIYNQSWRKRYADRNFLYFIRDKQTLSELYKNYGIRQSQMKSQLSKICNSFRQARGDGNCFYTSFGVQFFNQLISKYTDQEFNEFIEKMDKLITFNIKLKLQQLEIRDQNIYDQMWQEFKFRLQFLRNIKEEDFREQELIEHYAAFEESSYELIDGCFYGLATIFLRNLSYYLIEQSEFREQVYDKYNLLIWEEECNTNEIVIAELSKFLKVNTKLVFFDNGAFTLREYSEDFQNKIILLIRPGHYNVGYLEIEQDKNIY